MPFTLPDLPYPHAALEPHIDAQTMQIHHGKHHATYVAKLNDAIKGKPDLESKTIDALVGDLKSVPDNIRNAVRNNGGGHWNHSFFWTLMASKAGGQPAGDLAEAIKKAFGSFDKFKEEFSSAAVNRFGSGWAWLGVKSDGVLCVCSTPNQDNPLMKGFAETPCAPVLGLDVWEHAYYLKYQNRRADYVTAWWNLVNWKAVAERYQKAAGPAARTVAHGAQRSG